MSLLSPAQTMSAFNRPRGAEECSPGEWYLFSCSLGGGRAGVSLSYAAMLRAQHCYVILSVAKDLLSSGRAARLPRFFVRRGVRSRHAAMSGCPEHGSAGASPSPTVRGFGIADFLPGAGSGWLWDSAETPHRGVSTEGLALADIYAVTAGVGRSVSTSRLGTSRWSWCRARTRSNRS